MLVHVAIGVCAHASGYSQAVADLALKMMPGQVGEWGSGGVGELGSVPSPLISHFRYMKER